MKRILAVVAIIGLFSSVAFRRPNKDLPSDRAGPGSHR